MKKVIFLLFIYLLPTANIFISPSIDNIIVNSIELQSGFINNNTKLDISSDLIQLSASFDARDKIGLSPYIWNGNLTGNNVTVAVIDTGIYKDHSVFTENGNLNWSVRIIGYFDAIEEVLSTPEDYHGHGTWTASILGGNSSTYKGVAPGINYVIVNLFKDLVETNISVLENAVDWLLDNNELFNIKIVSMSFGAKPTDDNGNEIIYIQSLVRRLVDNGMFVSAAAGNDGDPTINDGDETINAPASDKKVLAVGGVDYDGNMYSKSSKGPSIEGTIKPDVCAPAFLIYGADNINPNIYSYRTGTSGAAPFVAGLAALMLEKDNSLSPLDLKNIISLTSFRTLNPLEVNDNIQGWGIVQGYAALSALESPILVTENTELLFNLNENLTVLCQPITLAPNHYFFELTQRDSTKADMYLFDVNPDEYGNPQLLSHSLNTFTANNELKRMGVFIGNQHDYFLVVKLTQSSRGSFSIKLVVEFRNLIIIAIFGVNILGIVYVWRLHKKFKFRG